MFKKILSAIIILQILTQSASAVEFRPVVQSIVVQVIPAQSLQITSDIFKKENLYSGVGIFSFFKISECFKLGLCRNETLTNGGTDVLLLSVGEPANLRLANFGAYQRTLPQSKMQPLVVFDDSGLLSFPVGMNDKHPERNVLDVYHFDWSEEGQQGPANTFIHDFDGNLTAVAGTKNLTYVYNGENRLITVGPTTPILNDKKIDSRYDYQGRRVRRVVSNWNGTAWVVQTTKSYVYNGWNVIEEITAGQPAKYYVWGLDLSQSLQGAGGVGGLLAKIESSATQQYLYDGNGNIGQLINNAGGALLAQYEYDPYGNTILASGTQSATNQFRFSTKYIDAEHSLYYYGYRFYDPATGRWVNRDPLEEDGGILLYGFNLNDPINHIDPDGEIPLDTIWDLANVVFDIAVGDYVSLTADVAALLVPYVPAGATKIAAGSMQLVKTAKVADIAAVCNTAKRIEVSYKYYGVANGFKKHTLPKSVLLKQWWKGTKGRESKFIPGWGDGEIKLIIEKALKDAKVKGKLKPEDIDGYVFDVGKEIGASNGKMTTKIKIHINKDGTNLHAFPFN